MRIWISDAEEGGTHGDNVKSAISTGYGSDISNEINLVKASSYSTAQIITDMALAYNAGYELFVQSAYGGNNFNSYAKNYYPQMLCVFPNGTNSHVINGNYNIPEISVITGAGDSNNETGYPIEFFDNDPTRMETTPDEQDLSSFSNGIIAGKLLKIKDERNCNWTEAVQSARATASLSSLDGENGYGIIDVNAAIAYTGTIALTVGTLTAVRGTGFSTTLTLERIIDATNYTIEVKDVEDIETTSLSNSYNLPDYDIYYFRYKGYNADLESDWSEWQVIPYPAIKHLIYRT